MMVNWGMEALIQFAAHKCLCRWSPIAGGGISSKACSHVGSSLTPASVIIRPRQRTSLRKNLHLFACNFRLNWRQMPKTAGVLEANHRHVLRERAYHPLTIEYSQEWGDKCFAPNSDKMKLHCAVHALPLRGCTLRLEELKL